MRNGLDSKQLKLIENLLDAQRNFFEEIGSFRGSVQSFANLTLDPTALFVAKVMTIMEIMIRHVDPEFDAKFLVQDLSLSILSNLYRLEESNDTLH